MFFTISKIAFLILRPSNAIILAMLAGLLLRWLSFRRLGALVFSLGLLGLVMAAWSGLSGWLLLPLETRFPRVDVATAEPPTGIIVLGGALDTVASAAWDTPQLVDGAERIVIVAELARRFPDARLVFTGGHGDFLTDEQAEALWARPMLETFGIPAARIEIETESRNTRENAVFTYDIVKPKPGETWWLVTSAFHMPRAMGVFRAAGWTGVTAFPVDFRTVSAVPVLGRQFASEGLFLTDLAVKEWLGLVAYRFAGYTDAVFPGAGE